MAATRTKAPDPYVFAADPPQSKRAKKETGPALLPFGIDIAGFDFSQKTEITPLHPDNTRDRNDPTHKLTTTEWAHKYRNIRGRPFTLERHKPLEQIYDDDHPHIVVIKPAQVGVSEYTLTKTMWALDIGAQFWNINQEGINVAYLFPTETALREFSKERFGKMRRENDYFETFFAEYDDVTYKQSGDSVLYLRGASSPTQLLSFPADFLILDEYDRMSGESISLARQRLRASSVQREIDISTPTLPGIGIDALYAQSDQHVWQVRCEHCFTYVELDFFHDVRLDTEPFDVWSLWEEPQIRRAKITMHCPACMGVIDPYGEGQWHAREPTREGLRGYHVPWYAFPAVNVRKLCLDAISHDPTKRTELFRSGLGQPYSEVGSKITEEMLAALSNEIPHGLPRDMVWKKTYIGIDVGSVYHYRVTSVGSDGCTYIRAMGKARSLDDIDIIMRQYKVRRGVIDALPEIHGVPAWVEKHKGRIARAFYTHGPRMQKETMIKYDPKKKVVTIHRTMAMDEVFARVAEASERWPKEVHSNREVIINMTAPVRIERMDDQGQTAAVWEHTAPDHYYHACLYSIVAGMLTSDTTYGIVAQTTTRGWNPK